jgi:hypothetical protein
MDDMPQRVYEQLALRREQQQQARERDIFLVLAADAALAAGRTLDAERLRNRLLELSPHNLLRPYPSFADALQSHDIQDYVAGLRRQFPPEQAARLLHKTNGTRDAPAVSPPGVYALRPEDGKRPTVTAPVPARRQQTPSPYAKPEMPPPTKGSDDAAAGGWLALLLFALVLVAATGLVAYVIARPFLF